jgi:phage-related protein
LILPIGYDYPVSIKCKASPNITQFGDGYQQRSAFESLKDVQLIYLGSKQKIQEVENIIDEAHAIDLITWLFRPHYANKKWRIDSYSITEYDENRLCELSCTMREYPQGLPTANISLDTAVLDFVPDASPVTTKNFRVRSSKFSYFNDFDRDLKNSEVKSIKMQKVVSHDQVDAYDLLLESARGAYPIKWQSNLYTCSDWAIVYHPEFAEIELTLEQVFGAGLRTAQSNSQSISLSVTPSNIQEGT